MVIVCQKLHLMRHPDGEFDFSWLLAVQQSTIEALARAAD